MATVSAAGVPALQFVAPVWGERYVRLFLDVTLPTLLAPRNIPCLPNLSQCVFRFFTMPEWVEVIRADTAFVALSAKMPTEIHVFDDFDENKYNLLSWGHLRGMAMANEAKAATVFLNADMVFSDGSFESVARLLSEGKRVIEIEGVRTNKPGMVKGLRELFDPAGSAIAIQSDRMVRLMLANLHRMTLTHFWEPEDDQGFMPFHTYFRAGRNGLIARSTHLYPFVVHPRKIVPIDRITTIDWDLVDQVCPDPEDTYVVTDSREILSAEISDSEYYVKPWYPRRDVNVYRAMFFHNSHCCSARHRDVLRHVISFHGSRFEGPSWWLTRRRVDTWYEEVIAPTGTEVVRPPEERWKRAIWEWAATILAPCLADRLPNAAHEVIGERFRQRLRRSYLLYKTSGARLGSRVLQELARAPRVLRETSDEAARRWLSDLDEVYANAFREADIKPATDLNIELGGTFFGTGWGDDGYLSGQSLRKLGPDDSATVHLRLEPADHDLELFVYSAPDGQVGTVRVLANDKPLDAAKLEWVVDRFRYSGVIPRASVVAGGGVVVLTITAGDPEQHPADRAVHGESGFSFTRLIVRQRRWTRPIAELSGADSERTPVRRRVRMLVALWGESYIRLFCQSCLPTLLAPGNLPALAAKHDVDLVFLTAGRDFPLFETLPEYAALREVVPVELQSIDDVLAECWHPSTMAYGIVLTKAFHAGVMAMGQAQLDTHFIFWNADFCASDGSFGHLAEVLAYEDVSAVLAASLRVDEEAIVPEMLQRRDPVRPVIAIPPRELARLAIDNLHPTVKAKTVNRSPGYVTKLANQFYWHVDDDLVVARNFLLFMLCIKPERICSEVATYCDYGFVAEMVPSGRVHAVADSDEMLLLELQNRDKEAGYLLPTHTDARLDPYDYCDYISEWSTAEHRSNSRVLTLFRAGSKEYDLRSIQTMTDDFMDKLYGKLYPEPRWHNGHPYWAGTVIGLGLPYRTSLPRSRHTVRLRQLGIDFDLYNQAEMYFGTVWRDVLSAVETDGVSDEALRRQIEVIDHRFPDVFRRVNLPHHSDLDLDLTGDFFGTGWGWTETIDGSAGRWIGPSGSARIWLRLQPGRLMYHCWLSLRAPSGDLSSLRIMVNENRFYQGLAGDVRSGRIHFFIPGGVVDTSGGCIEIHIDAGVPVDETQLHAPVSVTRMTVESIAAVADSWKVALPMLDEGKLEVVRGLLETFGEQTVRSTVGRLLIARHAVLSERRGWTRDDLSGALMRLIEPGDVDGVEAIAGSIARKEQDHEVVTRILDRLVRRRPGDGTLWMRLSRSARLSGYPRVAISAIERALALAEDAYVDVYPDVAEAMLTGEVFDPADHYLRHGAREGRWWPDFMPASEAAAALYLRRYDDVAEEIKAGLIAWADDHYRQWGAAEGREWQEPRSSSIAA